MKKILVAYDCSPEAEKALEHAISMAEETDEIIVLTVIPEPETVFCSDEMGELDNEKIQIKMDSLKENYETNNLNITSRIVHGEIISEILNASDDPEVRIIVLGYKGVSKLGSFKLGSVSGEVAKHAKKPVLVVK
jgi:nucleotide-binding universal stress UspA family protein